MGVVRTGQWIWRDGEISLKEFYTLSKEKREEYLAAILELKIEERSTTDLYLINFYKLTKDKPSNFFEL